MLYCTYLERKQVVRPPLYGFVWRSRANKKFVRDKKKR